MEEVMAVATINEASLTTERWEHMAVLCAAAEGCAFIKKKQRKKLQQRLLRPSSILVFTVIFTVKFLYLHFLPMLLLLPYSITFRFHTPLEIILYLQIPILANAMTTDL